LSSVFRTPNYIDASRNVWTLLKWDSFGFRLQVREEYGFRRFVEAHVLDMNFATVSSGLVLLLDLMQKDRARRTNFQIRQEVERVPRHVVRTESSIQTVDAIQRKKDVKLETCEELQAAFD
jgi:hypothetical protein